MVLRCTVTEGNTLIHQHKTVRAKVGAEILGIGESTFWRWHRERPDFPKGRRLSPRCTVFDVQELLTWRDAQAGVEVTQ